MRKKELFIFDVDGTLINAYPAIEKSLNYTRKEFGYLPISADRIKMSVGKGDKPFVELFFPKDEVEKALKVYRKHHKTALLKYSKLYPYTRKVLNSLRRKNKTLAIASNRPAFFTNLLIERLDIKKYFDGVYCGDKVKSLKPSPRILEVILKEFSKKRQEAVFIGDMDIDLETAKRAKIEAVFKKGGSSTMKSVSGYNKKVIDNITDLLKIYN